MVQGTIFIKVRMIMPGKRSTWSQDVSDKALLLWKQGVSAASIAKELNAQFGIAVTRSSVLGHLHRERNNGAQPAIRKVPMTKKSSWRKDDELWTNALFMRKRGHSWKGIAKDLELSISPLKGKLREIAKDDMAADGTPAEEWAHVFSD